MSDKPSAPVPDAQKKNLEWYVANQKALAKQYNGKILLIVDQSVKGAYDSMEDAYVAAIRSYALGSFSLQPCSPDPDSFTAMLYSPFFAHVAPIA